MGYEEFCQHLELCTEKVVVVHLADGDTITTRIHGTDEDIRAYLKKRVYYQATGGRPKGDGYLLNPLYFDR